jgi:choline dehydrogenase-like flavoprotein
MGPRPEDGDVVDALGRVHGVDRLSVVDASVIPDAPSGFPHVITIMLAEHLSERLSDLLAGRRHDWEQLPGTAGAATPVVGDHQRSSEEDHVRRIDR